MMEAYLQFNIKLNIFVLFTFCKSIIVINENIAGGTCHIHFAMQEKNSLATKTD